LPDLPLQNSDAMSFLIGGGISGALIRAYDWSTTPLGPPETWPPSLTTLVGVMLSSNQPMFLVWGADRTLLYNDAYVEILAAKHPAAMGQSFLDVWSEIRDDLGPIVGRAFAGEPVQMDDITLVMHRRGYPEETHFAFSYTPVRDETGVVAGFFCPCTETTGAVLAKRRVAAEVERQRRLFERAPGFITVLSGPEHVFEFVNRAYARLFGERDFVGKTVRAAFPELEGQGYFELLDQVYRTGERFVAQHVPIRLQPAADAKQDERFLSFIYEPMIDDDGRVTGIFCEGHDVTDVHLAQEALRASEARFRTALEIETVGAIYFDRDGTLTDANDAFLRMSGYGRTVVESGRLTWQCLTPPEWLKRSNQAFAELMANGQTTPYEKEYMREDGTRWWGLFAAKLLPDGTGFEFVLDITDRKKAETALQELNATLEERVEERTAERNRVWEMSRDLFAIMGFDGRLKAINPAWQGTLGFDEATLLARDFRQQVHPDDHAAVEAAVQRLRRGETIARLEDRLRHADGSWRWIAWGLVPDNDVFYAVGRDVTAEKEAAAELEQAQAALRQAQKMEAMGQLTGGVAHDFNNLLTPIIGSLDMLLRKGLGGEREQRLIGGALQSADRAKTLVQRLLAFARRQPLQSTAVDVASLTQGMADLIASTTGPQIKVVVDAPDGLPAAMGDANQLEMAILNLVVNARDAMPNGGTLRISVEAETVGHGHRAALKPGSYIRLSVADTGTGMDEATLARAIEPFFSTKGIGQGTGLGLSMVHGLASQLGGALTIHSRQGVGTNVELWLPQSGESIEAAAEVPVAQASQASLGTVLLVDDEDLIRLTTAAMLSELGYAVVEASSAQHALALIDRGLQPDLLVTDHLMPGMTGTDLARTVRSTLPKVRVLVVSGYAETDGIAPDLPRLRKPFRSNDLADCLATLPAS
jgi:PAS domain S-box-containing protein